MTFSNQMQWQSDNEGEALEPGVAIGPVRAVLQSVTGYDFDAHHMQDTPKRFVKMMKELTTQEEFEFTVFKNEQSIDQMVVVQDIPFYTLCAHHMIPFFGKAHIAYIPGDYIAGLSKFARTVRYFMRGLTVQEDLTQNICDFLVEKLVDPLGVAVIMRGEHLCMTMRGVQTPGTLTTTSALHGVFLDPSTKAREEFLSLVTSK